MIFAPLLAAALAVSPLATSQTPPPGQRTAFLTFEEGILAGVDWVERSATRIHTRSVLTQSRVIDATIDLLPDGTAEKDSVVLSIPGEPASPPVQRKLLEGAIYWSEMIPSSLEDAVIRARAIGGRNVRVPATSLYRDTRINVDVEQLDAVDWVIHCHGKRYEILTDSAGAMLSATLPDYGVTIERRTDFSEDQYRPGSPNGAPADRAYLAVGVQIRAPQGHILAGTLTLPPGPGPFPAAVLITGLGPSNRNNGSPPWMPLRDLADALTRRGIAVLRVDDRGVGESTGDHAPSTTFDESDDVRTEVTWLRSQSQIRAGRIALVGYSEGGLIAPMVAANDSTIAGIVTLAGPGVPGPEVARYQTEAAVAGDSTIPSSARLLEVDKRLAEDLTPRERSYLGIDPLAWAGRVRCPALVLQGGADLHVPVRSAERLAWAMRANGNRDVTVRIFRGLSHTLLPDPIGLESGWVMLPGFTTSPGVLDAIGEWAESHLGGQPVSSR